MPEGVCNVVTGYGPEVGAPMTTDPRVDMISFTGSTAVGRAAMAAASATLKKVSMELGGKNPQIVFADADLEAALDACVFGAYFNAGECCNAGSRLLLQRSIADDFLAALAERAREVKVGDPLDPETKVGAIISADHLAKIERHVAAARQAGAELRAGGERLASDGPLHGDDDRRRCRAVDGDRARGSVRPRRRRARHSRRPTKRSRSPTTRPTACRRASGAATSTR